MELVQPLMWTPRLAESIPEEIPTIIHAAAEGWLKIRNPTEPEFTRQVVQLGQKHQIGLGEAVAISLALQLDLVFITNDRIAYDVASASGVQAKWFTEILLEALRNQTVTLEKFNSIIDKMTQKGMWLTKSEVKKIRDLAMSISAGLE